MRGVGVAPAGPDGRHRAIGQGRVTQVTDAALGVGAAGAQIGLQTLFIEPTSVFSIQYSVEMLFMVLVGGMGTIEGPIIGALILFALQQTLSQVRDQRVEG